MTEQRMVDVEFLTRLQTRFLNLHHAMYGLQKGRPEDDGLKEELETIIASPNVGWQPIETAPKDGTVVIICEQTEPGFWEIEQGWWQQDSNGELLRGSTLLHPSHWMPPPQPPKED